MPISIPTSREYLPALDELIESAVISNAGEEFLVRSFLETVEEHGGTLSPLGQAYMFARLVIRLREARKENTCQS